MVLKLVEKYVLNCLLISIFGQMLEYGPYEINEVFTKYKDYKDL